MLHVLYYSHPDDKKSFFKKVKSHEDVWLVSHAEAKNSIQNEFLAEHNVFSARAVQRASEFWSWMMTVNAPEWSIVSDSLIYALMEEWFDSQDMDARYRDLKLFYNFFEQFLPLFSGESYELFLEWLQADPEREERLGGWLEWGIQFWEVLQEKKCIPRSWVLSVLLQKENLLFGSARTFYVDLGTDLQQLEVEMILRLAEKHEVKVLAPAPSWRKDYENLFGGYKKFLETRPVEEHLPSSAPSVSLAIATFASASKEVKSAVAQVRQWLDQGVPAHHIGIVSPKVEDYWDILREHLVVEGVALGKKLVAKPISLPHVQTWLSRLRLLRSEFSQPDLESFLFSEYQKNPLSITYRDFKKNYSFLYEDEAARHKLPLPSPLKNPTMNLLAFTELLYREWPIENRTLIDKWSDAFIEDVGVKHVFSYHLWLKYLEMIISRDESVIVPADERGVWVGNLSQADWTTLTHALVLGCTQNNLRENLKSPALAADVLTIENDLGVILQRVEQNKNEFELRWFLEKPLKNVGILKPQTDFEGNPQTASSFVLSLPAADSEKLPETSRWDEVMRLELEGVGRELRWAPQESALLARKLSMEKDVGAYQPVQVTRDLSVSASSFRKIYECGFKFYADKVLRLPEPRLYDLDIDVMYQGNLFHAMLELIGNRGEDLDLSEDDLAEIYNKAVRSLQRDAPAHSFWLHEREKHFQLIKDFLKMEKAWRSQFPGTRIHGTETPFKGYIGAVKGELVLSKDKKHPEQISLSGKIDRIDRDSHGRFSVTDYKTGETGLSSVKSWVEKGQFQMPLYAMSLEKGLAENIDSAEVAAAHYLVLKKGERTKGFVLNDVEHELGEIKKNQSITVEQREELFNQMRQLMVECLEKIARGEFPQIPQDFKICEKCNWSLVCRAPHLR